MSRFCPSVAWSHCMAAEKQKIHIASACDAHLQCMNTVLSGGCTPAGFDQLALLRPLIRSNRLSLLFSAGASLPAMPALEADAATYVRTQALAIPRSNVMQSGTVSRGQHSKSANSARPSSQSAGGKNKPPKEPPAPDADAQVHWKTMNAKKANASDALSADAHMNSASAGSASQTRDILDPAGWKVLIIADHTHIATDTPSVCLVSFRVARQMVKEVKCTQPWSLLFSSKGNRSRQCCSCPGSGQKRQDTVEGKVYGAALPRPSSDHELWNRRAGRLRYDTQHSHICCTTVVHHACRVCTHPNIPRHSIRHETFAIERPSLHCMQAYGSRIESFWARWFHLQAL